MKTNLVLQSKNRDSLEQGRVMAVDRLTGRVTVSLRNGLVSAATFLYDVNNLRVGMSVLVGRVSNSYVIINEISGTLANSSFSMPRSSKSISIPRPTFTLTATLEENNVNLIWTGTAYYFTLKRDSVPIYIGTDHAFVDAVVEPAMTYFYELFAYNTAGKQIGYAFCYATTEAGGGNGENEGIVIDMKFTGDLTDSSGKTWESGGAYVSGGRLYIDSSNNSIMTIDNSDMNLGSSDFELSFDTEIVDKGEFEEIELGILIWSNGVPFGNSGSEAWVCGVWENSPWLLTGEKMTVVAIFNATHTSGSWEWFNVFSTNISPLLPNVQDSWKIKRTGNIFALYRNDVLKNAQDLDITFPDMGESAFTIAGTCVRNNGAEGSVGATFLDNLYLWKAS